MPPFCPVPWRSAILAALCLFAAGSLSAQTAPPSFPGALGYGATATGGRTGSVYHVTNLADSGAGSFRDAVSASNRTIVFDVSGYVTLNSAVSAKSNLTIAGQTAPGGGIGFKNYEVSFANASNIICRYVRLRPGSPSPSSDDCLSLYQASTVIVDHTSLEFAKWNNIDAVGAKAITVQNSIIANPIGQQFGAHTESVGQTFSWFYNLFANSHNRNPLAKANTIFVNNVHYNNSAGYTTHTSTPFKHDIVNNYFIVGPASSGSNFPWYQVDNNQSMYFTGNLKDGNSDGALNGSATVPLPGYQGGGTVLASPWSPAQTAAGNVFSAAGAYPYVLSKAGALPRDEMDGLVISQVKTLGKGTTGYTAGTVGPGGGLYTSEAQTGLSNGGFGTIATGAALLDSDKDGMPDVYETALGWNSAADDHATLMPNNGTVITGTTFFPPNTPAGYTRLEEYLHFMAMPHAFLSKSTAGSPTFIDIDLRNYASGYTASPVFSVVGTPVGGTVALSGTGSYSARFTPTQDYAGRAMFDFKVQDASGNTVTQTFALLIASTGLPHNATWVGSASATNPWDTATGGLWSRDGGAPGAFIAGDNALFDDSSLGSSPIQITVDAAGVIANSMSVNAAKDYTFGGGSLSVVSMLVKDGNGTLTLNSSNTINGGVAINDGTVTLGNGGALGSGTVTLNDGALNIGANTLAASLAVPDGSAVSLITTTGSASGINALSGNGALSVTIPFVFDLKGDMSGFTGALVFSSGSLRFNPPSGTTLTTSGSSAATFDLGTSTSASVRATPAAVALGALKGGASTTLQGAGGGYTGLVTYTIGGNNASTQFDGKIIDGSNTTKATPPVTTIYPTSIAKTGSGTLTLTNSNSTYTGTTAINGGTLAMSGPTASLISVNSGGTLSPGLAPGAVALITANAGFTLAGGTIVFDLSNSPTGANDRITLPTGTNLTLSGAPVFKVNFTNGVLGAGDYYLIDGNATSVVSGLTYPAAPITPMPTDGSVRQTLAMGRPAAGSTPAFVKLTVTGNAASLAWTGASSGAWDLKTSNNWTTTTASLNGTNANQFYNFDAANFGDPAQGGAAISGAVALSGSLKPSAVNVTASNTAYSFTGSGTIDGPGKLVKSGSGTLTISNTGVNAFTGGTFLSGGTLAVTVAGGLGTGPVNISGGTLSLTGGTSGLTLNNSVVFSGSSAIASTDNVGIAGSAASAMTSAGNATVDLSGIDSILTVAGGMSGFSGTLAFGTGGGMLRLNGSNGSVNALFDLGTGSGSLSTRDGGVSVDLGAVQGGPNTMLEGRQTTPTGTDPGATTFSVGALNSSTTFAGQIVDGGAADPNAIVNIVKVGTGNWTLSGASNFVGDILVSQGTLTVSGSLANNGNFETASGATLALSAGTISTATVTIDSGATLSGCGTINADVSNQGQITVNCGGALTVNGDIVNNGTMTVSSGSTLIANGALLNNGAFTNNGTLDMLASPQATLPANFVNNGTVITSSALALQQAVKSGANMQITLQTYAGHSYQLERTDSLNPVNWQPITGQSFVGNGGLHTFSDANGAGGVQGFYRVKVTTP